MIYIYFILNLISLEKSTCQMVDMNNKQFSFISNKYEYKSYELASFNEMKEMHLLLHQVRQRS